MGFSIRFWMAALACAGAGFALVGLPAAPAGAAPSWRFEPGTALVGDTVSVVGSGWLPLAGDVSIFAPGINPEDQASRPVKKVPVDSGGSFSSGDFVVPEVPGGLRSFTACQNCSDPSPSPNATLTVHPSLAFEPSNGLPTTQVGVSGSGWLLNEERVLLFASEADSRDETKLITSWEVEGDGNIREGSTLTVPGDDPGTYTFYACQQCDGTEKAWDVDVPFEVLDVPPAEFDPVLDLATDKAAIGQNVIVTGTGWSDAAGDAYVYADPSDITAGRASLASEPVEGGAFTTTIGVPNTDAATLTVFGPAVRDES
jgi:hypothetical protein